MHTRYSHELCEALRDSEGVSSVVYFILAPHSRAVKIGFSGKEDGLSRLRSIQGNTPEPLEYLGEMWGTRKLEKALHHEFVNTHIRGEWFGVSDDIRYFYSHEIMPFEIWVPNFHPDDWHCHPWPLRPKAAV